MFNFCNFLSIGGGREDFGGFVIFVGCDCSKGFVIKRWKFMILSGWGNSCLSVFMCSIFEWLSEEYVRELCDK